MRAAIKALKVRLEERIDLSGFSVPLFDATDKLPPYAMLWAYPDVLGVEGAVDGSGPRTSDVYLTAVAGTGLGVLDILERAEDALTGGKSSRRLHASGYRLDVRCPRIAQPIQPDRDTTLEGTNRHPFFAVVSYPISIQKIGVSNVSNGGI